MSANVLIVDDDEKLGRLLTRYLADFGFAATAVERPSDALAHLRTHPPDIVILDIMLPEMNGFELCRTIRRNSDMPIVMLTARGEISDRVAGLELGADDYLAKPFEPRELVARIQSVLRRTKGDPPQVVERFGPLTIDTRRREVRLDDRPLELTTNEYTALRLLTDNAGRVMSRDDILQELRGIDCEAFNRSVDITVSRLRAKLGDDPKTPRFIKTVWGAGYVFVEGAGDA